MRPQILYPLFASINSVKGIGSRVHNLLNRLCGERVVNLLWHLPHNTVDRTYSPLLINAKVGKICTVKVKITEHILPKTKNQPYKIICTDGTDNLSLIFFKSYQESLQKNLPVGEERIISGKLDAFNGNLQMNHPDYIGRVEEIDNIKGIEPVYPLTAGISNKMMRKYIQSALSFLPNLPEWQDERFIQTNKFSSFYQSLLQIHNPQTNEDIGINSPLRRRLAYDELLANQLALAFVRQKVKKQYGRSTIGTQILQNKILSSCPFSLTDSQQKVLQEIKQDMASPYRMLRLLQGDVGSGKTIVALLSMINCVESGAQAAIMAPTEILAKQHLETIAPLCENCGIKVELLIGKTKKKDRSRILEELAEGKINILIGTHALFTENVSFKDLAYIVVDEQHRFGVQQRLALSAKGNKPDILVMTATPIPRTLILTSYGDMEYSKIDKVPEGRKPTDTRVMPVSKIADVIAGLKRKVDSGVRAYWVCPLVEESEKTDIAAAEERYKTLQKIFGNDVGLIHGKMKETEKDSVMTDFKSGKIKILVATTVIEVGVNVPEATLMIIEHAERFGLAQLHQLRGRIKRGFDASTCILLYGYPLSETSHARLNIMKDSEDGFVIAEKDMELRGFGEILGNRQSGFETFHIADLSTDKDLMLTAYKDALFILDKDPKLESPRGQALKILLYLFEQDDAVKTYLAG